MEGIKNALLLENLRKLINVVDLEIWVSYNT